MKLRERLIAMSEAESRAWITLTKTGNRYDDMPEEFEQLRINNAEELHDIIKSYGWPGAAIVDEDGEIAAFKVARNAISKPKLMKQFLEYIKEAVSKGEARELHKACLEDCILFYQNKPQLYGMCFDWDEDGGLTVNIENMDIANKNRKELGLETIEEAMLRHKNELKQEVGGIPKDIKDHKRRAHEWAESVGWYNA